MIGHTTNSNPQYPYKKPKKANQMMQVSINPNPYNPNPTKNINQKCFKRYPLFTTTVVFTDQDKIQQSSTSN